MATDGNDALEQMDAILKEAMQGDRRSGARGSMNKMAASSADRPRDESLASSSSSRAKPKSASTKLSKAKDHTAQQHEASGHHSQPRHEASQSVESETTDLHETLPRLARLTVVRDDAHDLRDGLGTRTAGQGKRWRGVQDVETRETNAVTTEKSSVIQHKSQGYDEICKSKVVDDQVKRLAPEVQVHDTKENDPVGALPLQSSWAAQVKHGLTLIFGQVVAILYKLLVCMSWTFLGITALSVIVLAMFFIVWLSTIVLWWTSGKVAQSTFAFTGQLICGLPAVGQVLTWTRLGCLHNTSSQLSDWDVWRFGERVVCTTPVVGDVLRNNRLGCLDQVDPTKALSPIATDAVRSEFVQIHQNIQDLNFSITDLLPQSNLLLLSQQNVYVVGNTVKFMDIPSRDYTAGLYHSLGASMGEAGHCTSTLLSNITGYMDIVSRHLSHLERDATTPNRFAFLLRLFSSSASSQSQLAERFARYMILLTEVFHDLEKSSLDCIDKVEAVNERLGVVQTQQQYNVEVIRARLKSWRAMYPYSDWRYEQQRLYTQLNIQVNSDYTQVMSRMLTLSSQLGDTRQLSHGVAVIKHIYTNVEIPRLVLQQQDFNATAEHISRTVGSIRQFFTHEQQQFNEKMRLAGDGADNQGTGDRLKLPPRP